MPNPSRKFSIFFAVLALFLASMACGDRTSGELIDEMARGPFGLAEERPSATFTVVAPSATATLTDTGMPATQAPPTPSPSLPATSQDGELLEAAGDEEFCGSSSAATDPIVDIRRVALSGSGAARIEVEMGALVGEEYSFALVVFVESSDEFRVFLWLLQDGEATIGEVDPDSFERIKLTSAPVAISKVASEDGERSLFFFDFAEGEFENGIEEIGLQAFHSRGESEEARCDYAGPFTFDSE